MGILTDPWNLGLVCACAAARECARRAKRPNRFPTELWVDDPPMTDEGVFEIGRYLPDAGEPCVWAPWDGGEQHLGIFGTTGSGKTVLAKLLATTAKENWGWEVMAIDGAKGGIDFTFMRDAELGTVIAGDAIPDALEAVADAIETRAIRLRDVRVRSRGRRGGVARAAAPGSIRDVPKEDRKRYGLEPQLVIIDELAILLSLEKGQRSKPISGPLLRIAAAGRSVGIHLACIMQRGDADLLSGFIGNLLRARVLAGATDQTAEAMAHGASTINLWRELMGADGWEPDGMERALRPPGRAFVSGLAARAPGLVQLYRFDSDSRSLTWEEYERRGGSGPDDDAPAPPPPSDPSGPSSPSGGPSKPSLSLVPESSDPRITLTAPRQGCRGESGDPATSAPRLRVV